MIVDLFAGPGGWSEGLRMLSPELHATEIGLEWDEFACATRAAANHRTIRTDIAAYPTEIFTDVVGLIASPPCQDFSIAGAKAGITGERGQLITEVLRWAEDLRPEWIACEQVPPALSVWKQYAEHLRTFGYSTWAGVLNAADYGVPQARKRAFLLASRVREVQPPAPTHCKPAKNEGHLPNWVTIQDATGYDGIINSGCAHGGKGREHALKMDATTRPSITVTTKVGSQWHLYDVPGYRRLHKREALLLQSFREDYPVVGNRTQFFQQVGDAVPPALAACVLAVACGMNL